MRIRLFLAMAAVTVLAGAADAQQKHPYHHFHHALWELRDARKELMEAKHDFGGHKEKALLAIHDAIKQLDLILAYMGDNVRGVPTRG
ncbi:MAG TPA: hypothetical protein VFE62_29420, partial [Gemmataceae bacterium]|nr:hypothetical protein [Gemmataceae bacterium]